MEIAGLKTEQAVVVGVNVQSVVTTIFFYVAMVLVTERQAGGRTLGKATKEDYVAAETSLNGFTNFTQWMINRTPW